MFTKNVYTDQNITDNVHRSNIVEIFFFFAKIEVSPGIFFKG